MKAEVYEIKGCAGSQRLSSRWGVFPTVKEAREKARELNEQCADRAGMSFRSYARNAGGEGWYFAGRAGFNGYRYDVQTLREMR